MRVALRSGLRHRHRAWGETWQPALGEGARLWSSRAFIGAFVVMVAGLIVALTNENFAVTRELTTIRACNA